MIYSCSIKLLIELFLLFWQIILAPQSRLRYSLTDPLTFVNTIKPRINKKAQNKIYKSKKTKITCKISTKAKSQIKFGPKKLKVKNKKAKRFFKKALEK